MTNPLRSTWVPLLSLALLGCEFSKQLGESEDSNASSPDSGDAAGDETGTPDVPFEQAAYEMALHRCAAWFECGCTDALGGQWTTQTECEADVAAAIEQQIEIGRGTGLVYDPSCVAQFIAFYDASTCEPSDLSTYAAIDSAVSCKLFHGDGGVGAACDEQFAFYPVAESCAAGLECSGDTCIELAGQDEPCNPPNLHPSCEFPLFCDPETVDPVRCNVRRAIGEPCPDEVQCAFDALCSDGICEARRIPGQQCTENRQCLYGFCDATGTCQSVPEGCTPWGVEEQSPCETARAAVEEFLDANRSCEVATDCVARESMCADSSICGSVSLAADHDAAQWTALATTLADACGACGSDPCGFDVACDDGVCGFAP